MINIRYKQVSVQFMLQNYRIIRKYAREDKRTVAAWIRCLVLEELVRRQSGE